MKHTGHLLSTKLPKCHAAFNSFLSDDSKQDASTTAENIKRLLSLSQKRNIIESNSTTIWDNTDSYAEQYIFETELYLL